MKTELKAKFLQHLNQKKKDEGFTLIELLVVIIIIGILSAIALPSFLNQASKAKQSEAKTSIGSVNSAQTSYRNENARFANDMGELALGLPTTTNNYTYGVTGGAETTTILATAKDTSLKGYVGGNAKYQGADSQSAIASVICETITAGTAAPSPPQLSSAVATTTAAAAAQCATTGQKQI